MGRPRQESKTIKEWHDTQAHEHESQENLESLS